MPKAARKIRHPKEGRFNSHRADPRIPPSAHHEWRPRTPQCLLGSARGGGI
ncbi:uncharacterized protein LACBIDRAFT_316948 [Laccaria bicolor S238N-H82]|uniref:Predicted protein n=1 Tax=Laccaria bicolor (strain S238N-H82 / ATCC MYA-4686) TaxID=486041 RepID=B0D410_LACBS|nr:uncharacterized protein LACBIDRAFT_316948 [Laccaria bicolor S238N-H82]EDR10249.1 predicted protein [Laccaria bicolor S238N-H82]|eukprot:XP_001878699.1 predicted protein [Laccaria bicolor S238N-H82]